MQKTTADSGSQDSCTHQWMLIRTVEATCTETGTAFYRCSLCSAEQQETIPALGHDWSMCTMVKQATCTEPGLLRCTCSRNPSHVDEKPIPALGHDWSMCTMVKKATCTEPGLQRCSCSRDSSHVDEKVVPALGHDWGDWKTVRKPTLTENGWEQHVCARCAKVERRSLPALAAKKEYALTLILTPAAGALDRNDAALTENGTIDTVCTATLINTGKNDLIVREYCVGSNQTRRTLETPLHLGSGEAASVLLHETVSERDLKGAPLQTAKFRYSFYADTASEHRVCISNLSTYTYTVQLPEAEQAVPTAVQEPVSGPSDADGFQIGETVRYRVTVKNPTASDLKNVAIEDTEKTEPVEIPAGEARTLFFSHSVTEADAIAGYVCSNPILQWSEEDGTAHCMALQTTVVPVTVKTELIAELWPIDPPRNGSYYAEGETVFCELLVQNRAGRQISDLILSGWNVVTSQGDRRIDTIETLASGAETRLFVQHTVTAEEAVNGAADFFAAIIGFASSEQKAWFCGEVRVPTGPADDSDAAREDSDSLVLERTEIGAPQNGVCHMAGETIVYTITIRNVGEDPIPAGTVFDRLSLQQTDGIASFETLQPGEEQTITVSHIVTDEDVRLGIWCSRIYAAYEKDGKVLCTELPLIWTRLGTER